MVCPAPDSVRFPGPLINPLKVRASEVVLVIVVEPARTSGAAMTSAPPEDLLIPAVPLSVIVDEPLASMVKV